MNRMKTKDLYWLAGLLEGEGSFQLTKGNAIVVYLGMNEAKLNPNLSKEGRRIDLKNGDWFILMTDGIFLPIVRDIVGINANVSKEDFYMENWLKEFLYFGGYFHPLSMNGKSRSLIKDLLNRVRNFSSLHKHYRDSIAAIAVQLI